MYEAAIVKGVFPATLRAELIQGEIIEKMPTGDLHAFVHRKLVKKLITSVSDNAVVGSQDPIVLPDATRPEPDVWLASPPEDQYATRSPSASDLLLVCEISDSSLAYDRGPKLALYAAAGIPEYWIVNVTAKELERHTQPREDGTYGEKRVFGVGETVAHELAGEVVVGEIFPTEEAGDESSLTPIAEAP